MIIKDDKKGIVIETLNDLINRCKYCFGELEDKKVYVKSFIMRYCPVCDVFFPKNN